ncbi:hypothetical protein P7K49_036098 [Saguinus oedipus]|uniref:SH3 domain-containing protein n=1 Tax=Saguinus oedipus TaxID=9490 RepID=A0ABQ9TPI3_SAGOE|nr:hypothetical protein P7K49_036098 [Saguinus oedipus]
MSNERESIPRVLMYRGEALEDFTGPDCHFVNLTKGDPVYVYYKLARVSPEVWAGIAGPVFGYFPKDLIQVVHEYTKEEIQVPTDGLHSQSYCLFGFTPDEETAQDMSVKQQFIGHRDLTCSGFCVVIAETDFICSHGTGDDFDTYNVKELLVFLKVNNSSTEDAEKVVEKTSQDVKRNPELSKESEPEPEPAEANSEESDRVFSEKAEALQEQFTTQKHHPHTNSQADHDFDKLPLVTFTDGEEFSDSIKTQTSELGEVFQNKYSSYLRNDNPEEHLKTSWLAEKPEGELSKEDHENAEKHMGTESQGSAAADLEDDLFHWEFRSTVEPEYSDKREDLPIISSFFKEQQSLRRLQKYFNVQVLEALLQKMLSKLKSAQQESLPYNVKEVLYKVFHDSESQILRIADKMIDAHVAVYRYLEMKENKFEEAAVLDDIQDLIYFVRYKYFTAEETATLRVMAPALEEGLGGGAMEEMQPLHEDDVSQENIAKLSVQVPEEPTCLDQWLENHCSKTHKFWPITTEDPPTDDIEATKQLEMFAEEPASITPMEKTILLIRSFMFYLTKLVCGFNGLLGQHMRRLYYMLELGTGTSVKCSSSLQDSFSLARRERHSPEMYYDNEQEGAKKETPVIQSYCLFGFTPDEETAQNMSETDFICSHGTGDDFDTYNVKELLVFLKVNNYSTEDAEKVVEKTSQDVKRNPELSKESEPEPEPAEANSEESDRVFSEKAKALQEQFTTQKHHPHTNSQEDHAQGEQPSFEAFEEMPQEKLKVPESENNKTSNSSQVSNEQHKNDAYKLLKKEMTLALKTKFGLTGDAFISDDETTRPVTSLEDDFDEDLDAEYYAVGKEDEQKQEDFDKLPLVTFTDGEEFSDSIKTQTSELGEVYQNKYSDYLRNDNPQEHLKTSWLAEKPEGELSKEDHENAEKHMGTESQGSAAANLEDDLFRWTPRSTVEPEYSDKREDLPIISSFFKEQQSLRRLQKYFNVHVLEDLSQKMLSKLKSAQQESLPYNVEEVLYKVFHDSESQILRIADKMIDAHVAVYRYLEMKENKFEEAAVLDDIQDLMYFVRYKYFTAEETATLRVMAPALEEGLGGAMEEMQPPHEDNVSQENIAKLSVQVPEEPTCLDQWLENHCSKTHKFWPITAEDPPTYGVEANKQLEMVVEEPASVTPLEKSILLICSFMFYLTKLVWPHFGYFPKNLIQVVHEYTKEELQVPTDETDFICSHGTGDDFDTYNVKELLVFLKVNNSSTEDAEKVVEKTSQDVKRNPELSKEREPEPEPAEANSEESDRVFSEKAKDLQEQFTAQKHHPHTNSQADHAQGEQPSFEAFEEMPQDTLKVPESESNKTSNSSQVSNEQHKNDAYKLLKKEMTLDLKTKFDSIGDAFISIDETTRLVTSFEDDFDEDLDAEYYAVGKEDEQKQEDFDKLPLVTFTDGEEFSDSIKTQTSQLGEVFQNKYSDNLKHDNREEHLKTSWLAEKPEGELSKEDHDNAEKHVGMESQGSAAADLEDDLFHWTPRATVEPEYSDKREDLPIISSFFKEQQSLRRLQKYFNVHVLEALLQKLLSKLKSAQQESLPYNVEEVLYKIFHDSESQILRIADKMIDAHVAVYRYLEMKENKFEEAAVLDDIQDLMYFVRYKYFTAEETATLRVMAPPLEEVLGGAMEEMQPPHEDDVSQENIAELSMQVPEEPTCLDQPVMRDTRASEVSLKPHTEKDLDPGTITTEDPATDGGEANKELEMVAEEPARVTPLEKTILLIHSFMFYLTKLVRPLFGYFPKNLTQVVREYTKEKLQVPTDMDFVCFDGGKDYFNTYNVKELLGLFELNNSSTGDAEKFVEQTSQDVESNPELSKECEPVPEPAEANSEESDRVFSEKAKALQDQLTAQKHHPHTNNQEDHAQGEQPSFEAL